MSGFPVTGSFSRTAVNTQFGATSLVAVAVSSSLVLGSMYLLLPVIAKLPGAALAPIIVQGALAVVDVHSFKVAFTAGPGDVLVMLVTFVTSLVLTVKEGLLAGFILSVLKTMYDLANPNLVVCGRLPDGQFRDIRNFPSAQILPNVVTVRMDARLSFANTRKMKEFVLKAVQIRERQGDEVKFVIVDCKSINHVDLTGCEMLEVLAETLKSRRQELVLANIKAPVGSCLEKAHVLDVVYKHGGHLCLDMSSALAIVSGVKCDSAEIAKRHVEDLLGRQTSAQKVMANNRQPFYKCAQKDAAPVPQKPSGVNELTSDSTDATHTPAEVQADSPITI
jgi:SulP family sulfate permease